MHRYKLITFDVTGTILKFKHSPGVQYAKAGQLFGIESDPSILTLSFKKQWKLLNKTQPNFGIKQTGWQNWWCTAVKDTFIDAGVQCDKEVLDKIAQHLIDIYTTSSCWQHCNGSINLLSQLKSTNIPLGIVSNFDTRLPIILDNMNVKHYFDFIITSYEVGHSKPDVKIFQKALEKLGKVLKPSEALHIGDTKELDCEGALKSGWNSWHIIQDEKLFSVSQNDKDNSIHYSGTLKQLHEHLLLEKNIDKIQF